MFNGFVWITIGLSGRGELASGEQQTPSPREPKNDSSKPNKMSDAGSSGTSAIQQTRASTQLSSNHFTSQPQATTCSQENLDQTQPVNDSVLPSDDNFVAVTPHDEEMELGRNEVDGLAITLRKLWSMNQVLKHISYVLFSC